MRGSTESRSFRAVFLLFALLATSTSGWTAASQESQGAWQAGDPYAMQWPQTPNLGATGSEISTDGVILADDFRCSLPGPISGIDVWAAFLADALPKEGPRSLTIEMHLYSSVPAQKGDTSTRPGEVLWTETFLPDQYDVEQIHQGPGSWLEPVTGEFLGDNYAKTFQYSFRPAEPPVLEAGVVYWLGMSIQSSDPTSFAGWKTTSPQRHWGASALYKTADGNAWLALGQSQANPLDLAFVVTSSASMETLADLGDAPDGANSFVKTDSPQGFPTIHDVSSPPHGPVHLRPSDAFFLGHWVSHENEAQLGPDEDGVNNLDALGGSSNADGGDDGLVMPVTMPSCQTTTLDYTLTAVSNLGGRIYVNIWCDWNRDGDWNDVIECPDGLQVPEWAVQDQQVFLPELGTFTWTTPEFLCWHPETADTIDPLWIRITASEVPWSGDPAVGGSGPARGYEYGETEDYFLTPQVEKAKPSYDWGDAPDSSDTPGYPTLDIHDGAWHIIGGPWLGNADDSPEGETNGLPEADAKGDNNENGLTVAPLRRGQLGTATLEVNGGGGVVQTWIDFNGNGVWEESEEVINSFLAGGIHTLSFAVPQTAVNGQTFARCRISTSGALDPLGPALDGEVEDHEVWIRPVPVEAKWLQWPDVTPDGVDVRVDGNSVEPRVLADDFLCVSRDLLTTIRLWGAWEDDTPGTITRIHVSIRANDPAGPAGANRENPFAEPGPEVLWEKVYSAGDFSETLYHITQIKGQWWWDAVSGDLTEAAQTELWQLDLPVDPNEAFLQTGSEEDPQTYWLAVSITTTDGHFGWRTTPAGQNTMGSAVMDAGVKPLHSWLELRYPQGHPAYDSAANPVDLAFGLMYTSEAPEQPTSRPGSVTQCPAVETMCPATTTNCPAITTLCPAVATKCPVVATQCPTFQTQCPAGITSCPSTMTQCPAVETRCPATETQCPAMTTQCPAVQTQCPAGPTQCPPLQTQCPVTQTVCPTSLTKCPTTATKCPATETQCPTMTTQCPAVATECPAGVTQCPAVQTQCPATATQCPSVLTECPAIATRCPATETQCPPMTTQCPAVATECPLTVTSCPINCSSAASLSGQITTLSSLGQPCPVIDVDCASVTDYLATATIR